MQENLPNENSFRFIAVLNRKIGIGRLFNALGHMTAGLVGGTNDIEGMHFLQYRDKDGGFHRNISHFPFIVLQADNSNQIRTLRQQLLALNFQFTDFTSTMTVGTSAEQQATTEVTPESELEYFGLCVFGETEALRQLTKKFSLFKNE